MKVHVESLLPCFQETVWEEVQKVELLQEVAYPLLTFQVQDGETLPDQWVEGDSFTLDMRAFQAIPLGPHTLTIERVDPDAYEIQTREHSELIQRWDHHIRVEYVAEDLTRYVDEVEIDAGWLTGPIWLFAQWFFRHRHRRWQGVADRLCECARPSAARLPDPEVTERDR